jgi:putative membrane protein
MEKVEKKGASPTDSLANERTFLAWIRTAIAIMAFGFVAVKFSLFINQIALLAGGDTVLPDAGYSYGVGIALIVIALTISILAFLRYKQVENQLEEKKYRSGITLILLLTASFFFVGILLLFYLL